MSKSNSNLVALGCLPMPNTEYEELFKTETPVEWLDLAKTSEAKSDKAFLT